jgi:hypothetical protein
MASKRKTFAVATLSALVLVSPALADGWWEPAPLPGGRLGRPDPNLDPALHTMANLIVSPTSYPILFPFWGPRCHVVVQPVSNYGHARYNRPTEVCE